MAEIFPDEGSGKPPPIYVVLARAQGRSFKLHLLFKPFTGSSSGTLYDESHAGNLQRRQEEAGLMQSEIKRMQAY